MPCHSDLFAECRRCTSCFQIKPLIEFRRRHSGRPDRLWQCRDCHNQAERQRRALRWQRLSRKQLSQTLTAIKNQQSDRQVKALCGEIAGVFGGLDGLVEAWQQSMSKDLERGGFAAFRHIAALVRLLQYTEDNKPNYGAMSDEELESAIWESGCLLLDSEGRGFAGRA